MCLVAWIPGLGKSLNQQSMDKAFIIKKIPSYNYSNMSESKKRKINENRDGFFQIIAFYCMIGAIIFYCYSFFAESHSTLETYVVERIKVDYADRVMESEINIETVLDEKLPKAGFQIDDI